MLIGTIFLYGRKNKRLTNKNKNFWENKNMLHKHFFCTVRSAKRRTTCFCNDLYTSVFTRGHAVIKKNLILGIFFFLFLWIYIMRCSPGGLHAVLLFSFHSLLLWNFNKLLKEGCWGRRGVCSFGLAAQFKGIK